MKEQDVRNIIRQLLKEAFGNPEVKLLDINGKNIVTGSLVKLGDKKGKTKGINHDLTVRVEWFLPIEYGGKISSERARDLEIY